MFTCLQKSTTSSCLPGVELEVVLLVPVHKVLSKFSVGSVVPDEADDGRVIRGFDL